MGWLKALAFALFLLGLEFFAQGWVEWQTVQDGFRRDVPVKVCSPITGREIPVDMWAGYDAASAAKE